MGGVGKTTLARVLFNQIANQFDGKSFVENVRECSKDARGLQDMQKQILTSVLCDQSIAVPSDFVGGNTMQRRMPSIKVLVVLDDVNDAKQLEALAEPSWFKKGSRIIITSRDRQVLVAHGVQSHNIHDVSTLSHEDAIRLLSKYAFNTESPAQGYEKLSEKVVKYAAGLPLTIKTLGSSLRDGLVQYWKGTIKRLKKIPCSDTLGTLKISYDSLEEDQKEIFLYVACLFKGETKKEAIRILKSLGFEARVGLRVLEQKSVITLRHKYDYLNIAIDDDYKRLDMHDHIEEMGMHIVRSLHPNEPQQHKLLWNRDEIEDIIENDMGTKAIRGIKLLYSDLCPAKLSQSLRKMRRLCFLQVELLSGYRSNKAGRNYLPNSLQFLHWKGYPYRYLPKTFQGDKLVEINMPDSSIRQLWKGGEKKVLPKLRLLNLSGSNLKTFDSAGMTPNLKELLLRECYELVEVNICDECSHLKKLDLSKCKALKKLTISKDCTSPLLEVLSVELCEALEELVMPVGCPELTEVSINGNHKLRRFNLGQSYKVEVFSAEGCEELEELVMPAKCPWLTQFSLKVNDKLRSLNLEMASNLEVLSVEDCKILEELVMPVECPMLTELSILKTKLRSFSLGLTPNLKRLILEQCEDLEELVMPVECPMLTKLSLCDNDKLRNLNLVQAPKLKKLRLEYCEGFENIYVPVELPRLRVLEVFKYDSDEHYGSFSDLLDKLKILKKLRLFDKMKRLPDCIYMLQHHLRVLDLTRCRKLEELPDDLDGFEFLVKLILRGCKSLLSIPDCICYMTRLERLNLSQCRKLEKLPDDFRHLQSLQVLNVSGGTAKRLKNLSESISQLKDLRVIGSS
uniref:disease resistance protein RUN1-like n=1 Tax=Erigeron canadensis TaxID=72917 RepID=UPI001CB9765A|nr:disease resistance protein RUN1-like [Erigeron canadensis]